MLPGHGGGAGVKHPTVPCTPYPVRQKDETVRQETTTDTRQGEGRGGGQNQEPGLSASVGTELALCKACESRYRWIRTGPRQRELSVVAASKSQSQARTLASGIPPAGPCTRCAAWTFAHPPTPLPTPHTTQTPLSLRPFQSGAKKTALSSAQGELRVEVQRYSKKLHG